MSAYKAICLLIIITPIQTIGETHKIKAKFANKGATGQ